MKTVNVDTKMKSKERIGFVVVVVSPKVRVARLTFILKFFRARHPLQKIQMS